MKTLNTLIKLAKQTLDEKRRAMTRLQTRKAAFEKELEDEMAQVIAERKLAEENHEYTYSFPSFLERSLAKQERIKIAIKKVDHEIIVLADSIAETFSELKKYEILKDIKTAEEAAKQARRDTARLDEIGMTNYVRKDEAK